MKKVFNVVFSLLFFLTSVSIVLATPGKLRGASIISCNGVNYGQHGDDHWHVAVEHSNGWYPSGPSLGYDHPCEASPAEIPSTPNVEASTVAEVIKSSDASLSEIVIDSESFTTTDGTISFSTTNEVVSINAIASDGAATIEFESNAPLEVGVNTRIIKVTAEDGTIAEYTLEITREHIESSNANLSSLSVKSEDIPVSDTMEYTTGSKRISISATVEDENAIVTIEPYELEIGLNEIEIVVTAEDGTTKEYVLLVQRLSDNVGLSLTINDQEILFNSFKAELEVDHHIEELELNYILDDPHATIELDYSEQLQEGENEVIITVTAENGDIQQYVVTVTRSSKTNRAGISIFVGGVTAYLVHSFKKKKKVKTN